MVMGEVGTFYGYDSLSEFSLQSKPVRYLSLFWLYPYEQFLRAMIWAVVITQLVKHQMCKSEHPCKRAGCGGGDAELNRSLGV